MSEKITFEHSEYSNCNANLGTGKIVGLLIIFHKILVKSLFFIFIDERLKVHFIFLFSIENL
jgi:hypothetical protein